MDGNDSYRDLYEHAPDMFLSVDLATGLVCRCNQTLLDKLGYTREEFIGRPIAECYHEDDRHMVAENLDSVRETGNLPNPEMRVLTKAGTWLYVTISYSIMRDEEGNGLYSIAIWKDITELQELRSELHLERERLEYLYQHAPDLFLSVSAKDGTVIKVNETLLRTLDFEEYEVLGRPIGKMYHPDDLPLVKENLQHFREHGTLKHEELRVLKKDGGSIEVSAKVSVIKDEHGKPDHSNAIWRDITVLKETQRSLERERHRSEELLLNILPASVVEELKEAGATRPVLFESATVLFTDFVGFSKTAGDMDPKELVSQLDMYFSAFDEIIEANGLEKLKTIGDAYMCVGGIPKRNDTHAMDCCRAALAMQRRAELIGKARQRKGHPAWGLRVGINTGVVIAGVVGKRKFAYDVWGDAVNMAARLESAGAPGRVNISASTHALVKDAFHCEHRGKLKVKNMGEVDMFFLP